MILISISLIVIHIARSYFYETMSSLGYSITSTTIEVDENLPNFFESVKLSDADWVVEENKYYRETYQLKFVDQDFADRLDDTKVAKKPISGIAWYNILANPRYIRDFNYMTASLPDREDYIVDGDSDEGNDCEQSDLVKILLNLAYLEPEMAK